ncbi:amylo-alpha-1,6-glucosidase [Streptomyces litchfieldiae]|uniref:Glycogen debranching N-terminal domain-containing protein n=1 Tax=Streptomyces litchfieldiae TaxID=3075543 RepID=A0ABU2MUP5_9ACTN|nr:glycogen debranching N-terminal domain-containing protein [Streptomyces sp. DSM 44938]MDT0345250.1 glycogen debranching N-terminal domain-containing protein [Streptomyces sp. DSM 44938]
MTPSHCLLVRDGTFATVGPSGDITAERGTQPHGLFARDARHVSRWQLTVDGSTPTVLQPATADGPSATVVLTPPASRAEAPALTVFREQRVADGALVERIRLSSNRGAACAVLVALLVDADFADQFELRSDHRWYEKPHAVRTRTALPDGVEFGYRRREWHSRTVITAQPAPDAVEETGSGARRLCWQLELPPHGSAELSLRAEAHPHGVPEPAAEAADVFPAAPAVLPAAPEDWPELDRACAQGLADLSGLRVAATGPDGEALRVPAAGVPWFLTLLGRHAAITSLFVLPGRPEPAAATLLALAAAQATAQDADRLAQPGKIVHELRHGELAYFGQVPYGRYFGSVDSTPLFLMLLGAHAEATGDDKLAHRLERHARAAVDWMFHDGGLADHGYLLYRPDDGGLANQSWKDSAGAICFADGTPARGVIRAAAAQGYAYDALRRTARLARSAWGDARYGERLETAAGELRDRFLADFWLPGQDFPALALDGAGRRADALASDAGHLLWTGILDQEHGERVADRLLSPEFFTGWGIRTLAAGQDAYHPLSYHRGSVWPHDSAIAALGLARYGLHDQARTLARGLLDMAARHGFRMPEVIAGYARAEHPEPVPYPHACSPQAWSAAAPFALLTAVTAGT